MSLPSPLQNFKNKAEKLLSELEKIRGATAVPLLYSFNRFIAKPDVDTLYDCLLQIGPQSKLDVIVFSHGGDPDQAYVMGNLLQNFAIEKLTVIIPRFVKSAATLIACAADEVVMGPCSELGPIDLIIERVIDNKRYAISVISIMELIRMVKEGMFGNMSLKVMELIDKNLPIIKLGDYGRLTEHTIDLAEKLLCRRMYKDDPSKARIVAKELCIGYKSHGAAIVSSDLQDKLKIVDMEENAWKIVWNIHKLWINDVIEYENSFPEGASLEPLNFKLGNGIVFCTKLVEGASSSKERQT